MKPIESKTIINKTINDYCSFHKKRLSLPAYAPYNIIVNYLKKIGFNLTLRDEANAVVAFAFRNGSLEILHGSSSGISDSEMKKLMIESCRKMECLFALKEKNIDKYKFFLANYGVNFCLKWEGNRLKTLNQLLDSSDIQNCLESLKSQIMEKTVKIWPKHTNNLYTTPIIGTPMAGNFPRQDSYSNDKIKLDKNFIKGLCRLKEEKEEIDGLLLGIHNRSLPFGKSEANHNFKHTRRKFSEHIKTIYSGSDRSYPDYNPFKKNVKVGLCEACNKRRKLEQAHVIKKAAFNIHYKRWFFLRYHPANILFLCSDCHAKFDGHYKNNSGQTAFLSKSQLSRVERVLRKRLRKVRKAIKTDERYLCDYEKKIDQFNDKMRKLLKTLWRSLR